MIGDTLIFRPEHYIKCAIVYKHFVANYKSKKSVISISGESGTGKTEIARLLQKDLWDRNKIRAKVIHTDDYYLITCQKRDCYRKSKGVDIVGINEINWKKLSEVLVTFKSKAPKLFVQKIHKFTDSIEYVIAKNNCVDVLIVEGLYAGIMSDKIDFNVFLEGTIEDTEDFRIQRKKEEQTEFRKEVLLREHKAVLGIQKLADLSIPFRIKHENGKIAE